MLECISRFAESFVRFVEVTELSLLFSDVGEQVLIARRQHLVVFVMIHCLIAVSCVLRIQGQEVTALLVAIQLTCEEGICQFVFFVVELTVPNCHLRSLVVVYIVAFCAVQLLNYPLRCRHVEEVLSVILCVIYEVILHILHQVSTVHAVFGLCLVGCSTLQVDEIQARLQCCTLVVVFVAVLEADRQVHLRLVRCYVCVVGLLSCSIISICRVDRNAITAIGITYCQERTLIACSRTEVHGIQSNRNTFSFL